MFKKTLMQNKSKVKLICINFSKVLTKNLGCNREFKFCFGKSRYSVFSSHIILIFSEEIF